jgi:integrase
MRNNSQSQEKTDNITNNLMVQVDKLFDNCNEKSFKTRYRYHEATERFCIFAAEEFKLQKFSNIRDKHITAYVQYLKDSGCSSSTIKTDLSGIRFFHRLSGEKFNLPDNSQLNLQKRSIGNKDRAWTDEEIGRALTLAKTMGRTDIYYAIQFSSSFGLRLEEVCRCTVSHLKEALQNGELYTKGKGGQERYVPIVSLVQHSVLEDVIAYAQSKKKAKTDKVFAEGFRGGTLSAKRKIQNWISNHRHKFQDDIRKSDLSLSTEKNKKPKISAISFHGLRHYYAQSKYNALINDPDAKQKISEELGHHRKSITNIYLNTSQKFNKKI